MRFKFDRNNFTNRFLLYTVVITSELIVFHVIFYTMDLSACKQGLRDITNLLEV